MSDHAGRFLQYVGGEPSRNLLTLVNPELRAELRNTLHRVLRDGDSVVSQRVCFSRGETSSFVKLSARLFKDNESGEDVVVVFFDETENENEAGNEAHAAVQPNSPAHDVSADVTKLGDLEQDLYRAQTQMDTLSEDASVSSEELMASNEELQAINEELRSTSEELEAGKEELQSVNEELVTVNLELSDTVAETAKANDDLRNLISSTGIATVFVDREMRIKRYTAPAVGLFKLIASDIGRPLLDLTHRLDYPEMAADARAAFDTLTFTEREVRTDRGEWFLARVLPYRTADDQIDGAVITLIDITARRAAEAAARSSEERLRLAAVTTNDYAIIVLDMDGLVVTWNGGAQRIFGYAGKRSARPAARPYFSPRRSCSARAFTRAAARHSGRPCGRRTLARARRWRRNLLQRCHYAYRIRSIPRLREDCPRCHRQDRYREPEATGAYARTRDSCAVRSGEPVEGRVLFRVVA